MFWDQNTDILQHEHLFWCQHLHNILICCFDAQDTFLIIINFENVMLLNIFMEVIEKLYI